MYKFDFVVDGYGEKSEALAHSDGFVDSLCDYCGSVACSEVKMGTKVASMGDDRDFSFNIGPLLFGKCLAGKFMVEKL